MLRQPVSRAIFSRAAYKVLRIGARRLISRMLAELRSDGLSRLEAQKRVQVLDRPGLVEMAEGMDGD